MNAYPNLLFFLELSVSRADPSRGRPDRLYLRTSGLFLFPSNRSYVIVWVSRLEPNAKELSHGMDNTSARRNRSELRNQLLRQRRAIV
jgi:hypothetical protein